MTEQNIEPIRIVMTDDVAELHRRVFPLIKNYAESPSDFEKTAHGVIATHLAQCPQCQQELNRLTVGGDV